MINYKQQLEAAYAQLTDQQKSMMIVCEIVEKPSHKSTKSTMQVVDINGEKFVYYMMQHYINQKYIIHWNLLNIPGCDTITADIGSVYFYAQHIFNTFHEIITILNISFTLFVCLDEQGREIKLFSLVYYAEKNSLFSLDSISRN